MATPTFDVQTIYKAEDFKESNEPVIGTHSGTHHTDEVTACWLLKQHPDFANSRVVRSRLEPVLSKLSILVDVGGVYNPEEKRFDHHQNTFDEYWSASCRNTKLSSAGLIWKHYGIEILKAWMSRDPVKSQLACLGKEIKLLEESESAIHKELSAFSEETAASKRVSEEFVPPAGYETEEMCKYLREALYLLIFESIDAQDNGVRMCECAEPLYTGGMPSMGGMVGMLNMLGGDVEKLAGPYLFGEEDWEVTETGCFGRALKLVDAEMSRIVFPLIRKLVSAKAKKNLIFEKNSEKIQKNSEKIGKNEKKIQQFLIVGDATLLKPIQILKHLLNLPQDLEGIIYKQRSTGYALYSFTPLQHLPFKAPHGVCQMPNNRTIIAADFKEIFQLFDSLSSLPKHKQAKL